MKDRGDRAELMVMLKALENGLDCSNPWGDNKKYDLLLERDTIHKVQVKATNTLKDNKSGGFYSVSACHGSKSKRMYTSKEIDFLIAVVIPENAYYIIPVEDLTTTSIQLYPHRINPKGFYEHLKDAWELLT